MKNEMNEQIFRHGDLLIQKVDSVPKTAKKTDGLTLALGEATGHHHTFGNGDVQVYDNPSAKDDEPVKWFEVKSKSASLEHQEHRKINIDQGIYSLSIEREYNPFDNVIRQVTD